MVPEKNETRNMAKLKTDRQIQSLKTNDLDGKDEKFFAIDGKPNLFIRLSSTEQGKAVSKTWTYRKQINKKRFKRALGDYPAVSMVDAFKQWEEINTLLAQGVNVEQHYKDIDKENARQAQNKFSTLCYQWAKIKGWGDNTTKRRDYNINLFVEWFGDKPINQISTNEIVELLQHIEATHRQRHNAELPADKATRCRGLLVDFFAWATLHGYTDQNPAQPIKDAKTEHILQPVHYGQRKALVKPNEFARLLKDIKQCDKMQPSTYHCLMLLAYTGVRIGDVRHMKWADLNLDEAKWELTPIKGQTNNGLKMVKQMTVPLSKQVIAILNAQHKFTGHHEHVFYSDNTKGIMSGNTTNQALNRLGYQGRHSSHGFRSSAKTMMMQELDYNDMITEMVLGHIVGGNHGNPYLRADLYQKRCELMQTWADYIDDLANDKDTTKYKGIYRQPHDEIIKVLISMVGVDGIHQLLKQHRE